MIYHYFHAEQGHFAVLAELLDDPNYSLPEGAYRVPAKPDGEYVWDADVSEWVEDDAPLLLWRESAQLSKTVFCLGLMAAGVLTPEEAEDAALGKWPTSFEAPLVGLSADERALFRVSFAGATHIRRNHPALALVQGVTSVTDAQLDAMFGWKS